MTVELNSSDYRFLRELLDREVGILLEDGKEYLAITRLDPVMKEHGIPSMTVLVNRLRKYDKKLKSDVIDAMTVNETLFFRDPNVWTSLREKLLPQIIEAKSGSRTLRMWSAACSSGQEPYGLAIVVAELLGKEDASWDVKIAASDLSTEMVARTKAGIFSNYEVSRGMDAETRDRYFVKRGDKWQVNDRLRSRVETRQANLSNLPPGLGPFDLIMLRNVLIYFSSETRDEVLCRMATMLTPTGCLLLGATEVGAPDVLTPVRMDGLVAFSPSNSKSPLGHVLDNSISKIAKSKTMVTSKPAPSRRSRRSTDPMPSSSDSGKRSSGPRFGFGSRRRSDAATEAAQERATKPGRRKVKTSSVSKTTSSKSTSPGPASDLSPIERLEAIRAQRERRRSSS